LTLLYFAMLTMLRCLHITAVFGIWMLHYTLLEILCIAIKSCYRILLFLCGDGSFIHDIILVSGLH